ncbi:Slm4p SCDLUD_003732 [Saccharomycodes ludwigii]|uniref:Slm4p n=1 Tax=Saccharomycodes ludwigii TaxID=36035 RepID=UPI001E88375C|nr:hypothetical protein SCDLUD_003732 [Saccharomycodes ludwigii]KAH3900727.1 hypothetical protein SCDLUD_003732 [Saccharomycodes ludwigii]
MLKASSINKLLNKLVNEPAYSPIISKNVNATNTKIKRTVYHMKSIALIDSTSGNILAYSIKKTGATTVNDNEPELSLPLMCLLVRDKYMEDSHSKKNEENDIVVYTYDLDEEWNVCCALIPGSDILVCYISRANVTANTASVNFPVGLLCLKLKVNIKNNFKSLYGYKM